MCWDSSVRPLEKQQHLCLYEGAQRTLGQAFPSASTFTGSYIFSHTGFKSQNMPVKSYNSVESCTKGDRLSSSEGKSLIT